MIGSALLLLLLAVPLGTLAAICLVMGATRPEMPAPRPATPPRTWTADPLPLPAARPVPQTIDEWDELWAGRP